MKCVLGKSKTMFTAILATIYLYLSQLKYTTALSKCLATVIQKEPKSVRSSMSISFLNF
jgi:hypothetical protein